MKKIILTCIFTLISLNISLFADDEIFNAMKDEMKRSLKDLKIENLNQAYYIEYILTFSDNNNVSAQFGALRGNYSSKKARLTVNVRVGDYSFDNTNFFDFSSGFFGMNIEDGGNSNRQVPFDLDYNSLRRELWLASDIAYKSAVETYTKKLVAIKNKVIKDTIADFAETQVNKFVDTLESVNYNHNKYIELCKKISEMYVKTDFYSSLVSFEYNKDRVYFLNSEGTQYIKDNSNSGIEITAFSQCDDGLPVINFYSSYALNPNNLPNIDSLERANKEIINILNSLVKAPVLDDFYTGPILFTSQAVGEIFSQVFIPNLVAQRSILSQFGKQQNSVTSTFQNKIGGRVLPEFLSINAIPTEEKFDNKYLFGYYKYDDEGVKAQTVNLVKNGYLKTLLTSRVPIKRIQKSNGHYRNGGAITSNIQLISDKNHSKSYVQLKEQMISLCKDRELPFGIVVKKLVNKNILFTGILGISGNFITPKFNHITSPIEVYKVFPDGREELIRGAELGALTAQSFKDVIQTGNTNNVYNFLMFSVVSNGMFSSSFSPVSVIIPDLLFEDAELKPNDDDYPKLPFITKP